MHHCKHVHGFFDNSIGDYVGSTGDCNFARSRNAAKSPSIGHAGGAQNCIVNVSNCSFRSRRVLLGDVFEYILELVGSGH